MLRGLMARLLVLSTAFSIRSNIHINRSMVFGGYQGLSTDTETTDGIVGGMGVYFQCPIPEIPSHDEADIFSVSRRIAHQSGITANILPLRALDLRRLDSLLVRTYFRDGTLAKLRIKPTSEDAIAH